MGYGLWSFMGGQIARLDYAGWPLRPAFDRGRLNLFRDGSLGLLSGRWGIYSSRPRFLGWCFYQQSCSMLGCGGSTFGAW